MRDLWLILLPGLGAAVAVLLVKLGDRAVMRLRCRRFRREVDELTGSRPLRRKRGRQ